MGKRRSKNEPWPCTAEDIIRERDEKRQSWKVVANTLGLGNPGAARKCYADLTGREHRESKPIVQRAPRGSNGIVESALNWGDDTDQGLIEDKLRGHFRPGEKGGGSWAPRRLSVRRDIDGQISEIECRYATKFTYGPQGDQDLQVEFIDNESGGFRTVFVRNIMKVSG